MSEQDDPLEKVETPFYQVVAVGNPPPPFGLSASRPDCMRSPRTFQFTSARIPWHAPVATGFFATDARHLREKDLCVTDCCQRHGVRCFSGVVRERASLSPPDGRDGRPKRRRPVAEQILPKRCLAKIYVLSRQALRGAWSGCADRYVKIKRPLSPTPTWTSQPHGRIDAPPSKRHGRRTPDS